MERHLVDVLAEYTGPAAIHSFDHDTIGRLSALTTNRRLGLLTEDQTDDPAALLTQRGAHDFWPHAPLVTAQLVEQVHAIGGRVIPWTVNEPAQMIALANLRVAGICTDDVSALSDALHAV
jgi:glycerophosphoryl diester phosphodiesterase